MKLKKTNENRVGDMNIDDDNQANIISQTQTSENLENEDDNLEVVYSIDNNDVLHTLTTLPSLAISTMRRKRCTKFILATYKNRNMQCDRKKTYGRISPRTTKGCLPVLRLLSRKW